jgi:hypothetical protein
LTKREDVDVVLFMLFGALGMILMATQVKPTTGGTLVLPRRFGEGFEQMRLDPDFAAHLHAR